MAMHRVGHGDHAVICLHGWFGSARGWGYLPEIVDTDRFSYYFPEMRGFGDRRHERGQFTMREYACDAVAAADAAGIGPFSVVGHSMGAKAGAALLALAPERVRALVGIAAVSPGSVPLDEDGRDLFFGAPVEPAKRRAIIDFTTGGRHGDRWLDDMVRRSLETSDLDAFTGAVHSWAQDDYTGEIGPTPTPILVIAGEHDAALSAEVLRGTWLAVYPGASLVEMPACGHYPMHEAPVALATQIESFLGARS